MSQNIYGQNKKAHNPKSNVIKTKESIKINKHGILQSHSDYQNNNSSFYNANLASFRINLL
jgi:hypothetical protein